MRIRCVRANYLATIEAFWTRLRPIVTANVPQSHTKKLKCSGPAVNFSVNKTMKISEKFDLKQMRNLKDSVIKGSVLLSSFN